METIEAFAPGRVNLIGDHTDHTGGLSLPMALTWGVTIRARRSGDRVVLRSDRSDDVAEVPLDVTAPGSVSPAWARYVAGVVAEVRPTEGLVGLVTSDLPMGAGLSSSAALEVAVAVALGGGGDPLSVARLCQRAEHAASGVPCGILDQLTATSGVAGHALFMDCSTTSVTPVAMDEDLAIVVVHSGEERALADSAYAHRRRECEAAQEIIGPLRSASLSDAAAIDDDALRRRARHVITENARVSAAASAVAQGDRAGLGDLFRESHASLRDDFECSTPVVDALVERLGAIRGVHGARMTGGGWGGCVVAVADPGALSEGWTVSPGGAARVR